jgi:hypothetical protein
MSASGGKADIPDTPYECPLMTQSGLPSFACLLAYCQRSLLYFASSRQRYRSRPITPPIWASTQELKIAF